MHVPIARRLFSIVVPVALAGSAAAQLPDRTPPSATPRWQQLGPLVGAGPITADVVATAARPDDLYASTAAGLARSTDRGVTWTIQSAWPGHYGSTPGLAVSSTAPDHVAISRFLLGAQISHDGGATWWRPTTPPTSSFFYDVTFDPVDPDVLFHATDDGVWRSTDGGVTFDQVVDAAAYGTAWCYEIDIDPSNRNRVFACLGGHGVLVSLDGGSTWELRPFPPGVTSTFELAIDPRDGRRLLLGAEDIWFSDDAGVTWTSLVSSPRYYDTVAFDAIDPDRLFAGDRYGGLLRSDDAGVTWTEVVGPGIDAVGGNPFRILSSTAHPGEVIICGRGGFARSTDGGVTFQRTNAGLEAHASVLSVAVDPFDPLHLVAKTGGSAFVSFDGGGSWTESVTGPSFVGDDVVADRAIAGRFYAGGLAREWGRLWRSDDGGLTFAPVFEDPVVYFWHLEPHPTQGGVVFGAGRGVQRSDDGGVTFSSLGVPSNWIWDVAVSPSDSDVMYASSSSTVFASHDAGATWAAATTPPAAIVRDLEVDPNDANRAWACTPLSGLFRTDDGGVTWTAMPSGSELVQSAHVSAADSSLLLTCDARRWTAYASWNGGLGNAPFGFRVGSVINSFASSTVETYAATLGGGVFVLR